MQTITGKGTGLEIKNWNVSSKLSPVTFEHPVNFAKLQLRTAVDILVFADDNDQSEYFTLKSGTVLDLAVLASEPDSRQVAWVKLASGTAVLEGIGIY